MPTHQNYEYYQQIRPQLRGLAMSLAGGDQFTCQEILAEAEDLFSIRFSDNSKGVGGAVKLSKLLLFESARNLGYLRRKDVAQREFVALQDIGDLPTLPSDANPIESVQWGERKEQLSRMLRRACPRVQQFFRHVAGGKERDAAALAAGLSQVEVTRLISMLASKLNGRPAAGGYRRRDRAGEAGQLALFGV